MRNKRSDTRLSQQISLLNGFVLYTAATGNRPLNLQELYDFTQERNEAVHKPEKFVSRKSIKLNSLEKRFQMVLDTFNNVFSEKISIDDFTYILK